MTESQKPLNKPLVSWVQNECDCFLVVDPNVGPMIEIYPHVYRGHSIKPLCFQVIAYLSNLIPAELTRIELAARKARGELG